MNYILLDSMNQKRKCQENTEREIPNKKQFVLERRNAFVNIEKLSIKITDDLENYNLAVELLRERLIHESNIENWVCLLQSLSKLPNRVFEKFSGIYR